MLMLYLAWELVRMRLEWRRKRSQVPKDPHIDYLNTQQMVVWAEQVLAKFFTRFYTPLQNDFWLWLTDRMGQEFVALLWECLGKWQEDAKCCSGPTASVTFFSSVLDLRPPRDIRRLHEQGFYWVRGEKEGEWCSAKDSLGHVYAVGWQEEGQTNWKPWFTARGLFNREGMNWQTEQLQAWQQSLLWSWDKVIPFSVHFSWKNEVDPCGIILEC